MRTVERSRFVRAGPDVVARQLSPWTIVDYEGTFSVLDVEEREADDEWIVHAAARGLETTLRFERLEKPDGFYYEQEGDAGPLETMETTLTHRPENEGTRVSVSSTVSLGLRPAFLSDRIAGWKRRGELKRALERLADDVE